MDSAAALWDRQSQVPTVIDVQQQVAEQAEIDWPDQDGTCYWGEEGETGGDSIRKRRTTKEHAQSAKRARITRSVVDSLTSRQKARLGSVPVDFNSYANALLSRDEGEIGPEVQHSFPTAEDDEVIWDQLNNLPIVHHEQADSMACHASLQVDHPDQGNAAGDFKSPGPEFIPLSDDLRPFLPSPMDGVMAQMFKVCDDAGAPLYLCDKLMDVIRRADNNNIFDPSKSSRRASFIARAQKKFRLPQAVKVPVKLEGGNTVHVCRYNFINMYQEHLRGEAFANEENLVLQDEDSLWECRPSDRGGHRFDEINYACWYRRTAEKYRQQLDSGNYVLDCLMIYADKTGTDQMQRHSLEPVMFTSTILNKETREKSWAWKPLGLIPNLSSTSSAKRATAKSRMYSKSFSVRDYHKCLSAILEPLKQCQQNQPIMVFRRGDYVKAARVICPLAVVVGDNLSNSNMCGKIMNYTPSSVRMGRRCLTCFRGAEKTPHECMRIDDAHINWLQMGSLGCKYGQPDDNNSVGGGVVSTSVTVSENSDGWDRMMERMNKAGKGRATSHRTLRERVCTDILWKVYGSHSFLSGFHGIDFGANPHGIHRATVTDIMHTIEEGLMPKLVEVIYGLMPPNQRTAIDELVDELFSKGRNRSGERESFARVNFVRGYSSLSLLSAGQRVGQLFVLAVLLNIPKGVKILEPRFREDFDEHRLRTKERLHGGDYLQEADDLGIRRSIGIDSGDDESGNVSLQEDDDDSSEQDGDDSNDAEEFEEDGARQKALLHQLDLEFVDKLRLKLPQQGKDRLDRVLKETLKNHKAKLRYLGKGPHVYQSGTMDYINTKHERDDNAQHPQISGGEIWPTGAITESTLHRNSNARTKQRTLTIGMDQFKNLVERVLTMHATMKYGAAIMEQEGNWETFATAVERLRMDIRESVHRAESSNGYCTEKFLELQHFIADFKEYGIPSGYSTETGERGLKTWAKKPARNSQQRDDETFSGQTCARLLESSVLRKMIVTSACNTSQEQKNKDDSIGLYNRLFIYWHKSTRGAGRRWNRSSGINKVLPDGSRQKNTDGVSLFPPEIKRWFDKKYKRRRGMEVKVKIFSELKKGGVLFRAHQDYRSRGPWYDYATIKYEVETTQEVVDYPVRIAAFFVEDTVDDDPANWKVLVQECEWRSEQQIADKSLIFEHYTMRGEKDNESGNMCAVFEEKRVEELNSRIFCIERNPVGKSFWKPPDEKFDILVVRDQRTEWHKKFLATGQEE
jgi:hypothetical protein